MKISNIKCKLKHLTSTMVICGSYMFECSVGKDMKNIYIKGGDGREGRNTFMSNTNYQEIEN
jgi:hypothetical protein